MPSNNGAVLMISQIIKGVMPLVAEAEIQDLYVNCRDAVSCPCLRDTLIHAGPYTQPSTPMQMDKKISIGMVNNNVTKKLKAVDMNYLWLRCRINP
jgi:hypothetical protein